MTFIRKQRSVWENQVASRQEYSYRDSGGVKSNKINDDLLASMQELDAPPRWSS